MKVYRSRFWFCYRVAGDNARRRKSKSPDTNLSDYVIAAYFSMWIYLSGLLYRDDRGTFILLFILMAVVTGIVMGSYEMLLEKWEAARCGLLDALHSFLLGLFAIPFMAFLIITLIGMFTNWSLLEPH